MLQWLRPTLVVLLVLAEPAAGRISIDSITVLPTEPITPQDSVMIEVVVYSTTVPVFPFQPTEVNEAEGEIAVDIFLDAGDGDAITWVTETANLGVLQPGSYSFVVRLIPGPNTSGGGASSGEFQVIRPVPTVSNWGLVAMILLVLAVGTTTLRRKVMERKGQIGRRVMRNGMAAGVWLGVALGIGVLAPSESNAVDPVIVLPSSYGEEPAAAEHTNGDAPPEVEAAEVVATLPGEPELTGRRPVIKFENANPRVSYGGLIERRMGTQGSYREKIRHQGVYSSQHAQPDVSGQIRYSGVTRGRMATYDANKHRRIRVDSRTRGAGRWRVQGIWENFMGADLSMARFGIPGTGQPRGARRTSSLRHHSMGGYRENTRFGVADR
jgi:hypothetical protein